MRYVTTLSESEIDQVRNDAESAAKDVYDQYWAQQKLPVDPVVIATAMGAQVVEGDLPHDVSGKMVLLPGYTPMIYIDANEPPTRKRFSSAHELAHFVMAVDVGIEDIEQIEYRDQTSDHLINPAEVFADRFAACLLMPEFLVKRYHSESKRSLASLAKRFGVSIQAMARRVDELGLAASV